MKLLLLVLAKPLFAFAGLGLVSSSPVAKPAFVVPGVDELQFKVGEEAIPAGQAVEEPDPFVPPER